MPGCAALADPLFVAPHYDDVALSCGGLVALAARAANPRIVTVFGGEPDHSDNPFAHFQHQRWGLAGDEVIAARRTEDACAAAALGASVRTHWLKHLDAIYRNPAYDSDEALFGSILDTDSALPARIAADLAALAPTELYVPLAFGNHVDHQLTLAAGELLAAEGFPVWGYLDTPYVVALSLEDIAAATSSLERRVVPLDADTYRRRIAAVTCYASQLPVLFRDLGAPEAVLRDHLLRLGEGRPAEVVYRLPV